MKNAKLFIPYLIWPVFLAIVIRYYEQILSGGEFYKTGDWLINYAAGPVRRGLVGEILFYISNFGLPLKWLVFFTQVSFYFLIFILVQKIYLMRERGSEWLLLLFSPAFIFFAFYDFQGGFRKEIIVFLSFLVLALSYARQNVDSKTIIVSYALFLLAVFSHELAAFTLPFFGYIFFNSFRSGKVSRRTALIAMLLFSVTALLSLLFAQAFPGGELVKRQICNSVVEKGFSRYICDGAIQWIGFDAKYALQTTFDYVQKYFLVYPFLLLLATLPLLLSAWAKRNLVFLLVGFCFLCPLFVVATDWGRWTHIYFFFVFVLILSESVWQDIKIRKLPILVLIIYLTTWSIPHQNVDRIGFGLAEPVIKLHKYLFLTPPA